MGRPSETPKSRDTLHNEIAKQLARLTQEVDGPAREFLDLRVEVSSHSPELEAADSELFVDEPEEALEEMIRSLQEWKKLTEKYAKKLRSGSIAFARLNREIEIRSKMADDNIRVLQFKLDVKHIAKIFESIPEERRGPLKVLFLKLSRLAIKEHMPLREVLDTYFGMALCELDDREKEVFRYALKISG